MKNNPLDPYDYHRRPDPFQAPRPMPLLQKPKKKLPSPRELPGLPKIQVFQVIADCLPKWLYLIIKHFGGYILFIAIIITFIAVARVLILH